MKVLLVAVNAKYIHSNLAVYSLQAYAGKYAEYCKILEYTINHSEEDILKGIYKEKADIVAFSCYIWNISMISHIIRELKKVQPKVQIWLGGPEVSYDAEACLRKETLLSGIMVGEGEQTFLELMEYFVEGKRGLGSIAGLAFRNGKEIIVTGNRPPLSMDEIPFPYMDMERFRNKIIYYETSRGCPFSCSYCLSSIEKGVRLRSMGLVKKELKSFLDYGIPQVKFVDRTFNCNKQHAMDIWRFIKEHDNGITNFHFELSADILDEEELSFLATLRPGQVQFEIGVQSTHPKTVEAIHRKMDFDKLSYNVKRIRERNNIHQHLDLIAGLPLEDYADFENSFRDVYGLKPDQLQLGFLKILKGSRMENESTLYGIQYRDTPPYEVLFTNHLTYDEVLRLKGICEMVEVYYNSGQFKYSILYLEHSYTSPMKLYEELYEYYEEQDLLLMSHSRMRRFEILLAFYQEVVLKNKEEGDEKEDFIALFKEILVLDILLREDLKSRPSFAEKQSGSVNLREIYDQYRKKHKLIHIEEFEYDVIASATSGRVIKRNRMLLFDYSERDPLNKAAKITFLDK
ncbi:B12-binding domain-containing radical SAM protein [Lachnospiraceae bacterium MD1]|uniref:B12-binding domain-containing radical SAM protein n=1 Tax=Variimorphobacter saccharofermentans TaxID=2755051 RepID=A0A839K581_9FIRM|nr:B12-binding domain-containing radical SAM protein [Variimorphobacter saccharofermentans]MBB2184518.1 B12-binding domain-containing radical SAM protein [Variimorphobacter saccharofermentans]